MTKLGRRAFVASALATSVAALALPRTTKAADSQIEIVLDEPIGSISPAAVSQTNTTGATALDHATAVRRA